MATIATQKISSSKRLAIVVIHTHLRWIHTCSIEKIVFQGRITRLCNLLHYRIGRLGCQGRVAQLCTILRNTYKHTNTIKSSETFHGSIQPGSRADHGEWVVNERSLMSILLSLQPSSRADRLEYTRPRGDITNLWPYSTFLCGLFNGLDLLLYNLDPIISNKDTLALVYNVVFPRNQFPTCFFVALV